MCKNGCSNSCSCENTKEFTSNINYDGNAIPCLDTKGTIIPPYSGLNDLLQLMTEKLCQLSSLNFAFDVKINSVDGYNLTSIVTGGVGPYTYLWEFADIGSQFKFNTATNTSSVQVIQELLTNNVFDAAASNNSGRVSLVKLIVTDSVGNIAKDTYLCIQIIPL